MKLANLAEVPDEDTVYAYVRGLDAPGLEQAVTRLAANKDLIYKGQMFRTTIIGTKPFTSGSYNPKLILESDKVYLSWSKSLDGMDAALNANINNGLYDDFDIPAGVVLVQNGTGLDIPAMLKARGSQAWDEYLHTEQEVLAKLQQPKIFGYYFWGSIFDTVAELVDAIEDHLQ